MDKDLHSLRQQLAEERRRREKIERAWDDANRRHEEALQVLRAGSFIWRPKEGPVDWNEGFSNLHDPVLAKPVEFVELFRILNSFFVER